MCATGHQSDSEPQGKLCEKAFFEIVKDLDKWFSGWKMSQFQHKKPTTTLPPLLFSSKWPKMRSNMSLMASSFEKLSLTTMISFSIFCFSSNGQVQFHLAVVKWCLLAKKPCNFMRCPDFLTQILIFGCRPNAKIETASLTFIQLDLWCQRKVKISGKPF